MGEPLPRSGQRHHRKLLRFTSPALLILEDLGLRQLAPEETVDLCDVIRLCYERGSILIPSNRALEELPSIFGDPLSSAAMDCLLDDAHVVVLEGDSYRNPPPDKRQAKRNTRRGRDAAP